jgi:hypothetical protein
MNGPINIAIGFDASTRRVTIDGQPTGEPIMIMTRAEAEGFDYQAEADKTCSIVWNPQYVDLEGFRNNLKQFVELASVLNLYKKLLFRGKTPDELMMPNIAERDSMAAHGGCVPAAEIDLVHGILGNATEAGELAEILLDLLDGKTADRVNVVEEVGDCRWYLNRCLRWAEVTDLICEVVNIDKLHGRGHANGLDIFADANRNLNAERSRLERAVEPGPLVDQAERLDCKPLARCMGGRQCAHSPGTCTATRQVKLEADEAQPKPVKRRYMAQKPE